MSSNELIIPLSKTKVVFLIFGSMGFIALGAWFLTLDTEEILVSRKFISPELVYGIGMVSIVFFGLCGMIGVKKFLDTKPGLILNSKGVTDNSSGVSAGFIPWSEIVGINESHIHKQKFVSIMVKNPEKYLNSGNALQK
ncbi:MAG: STM3941 family protein, partial [Cyanobacteria bacterium P01_E01_bin.45]